MSDDVKRLVAEIDADTHHVLKEKLDHGELSELMRDVANTVAFGDGWDRQTLIDKQIEAKREDLRSLREDRREVDAAIESAEEELRELERERERVETEAEQYTGALWSLEQSFRAGELGHLDEEHPRVDSLAEQFNKSTETVFEDLQDRNPDVPEYAFTEVRYAEWRFDGLPGDEVDTPVEERESSDHR